MPDAMVGRAAASSESGQLGLFAPGGIGGVLHRHPRANRECRLGDELLAYEFQRGQRRTIGLSIGPLGLSVRAPSWTPQSEVDALVQRKADWVRAKLRQLQQVSPLVPAATEWREGAAIPYLGRRRRWHSRLSTASMAQVLHSMATACCWHWRVTPDRIGCATARRPG